MKPITIKLKEEELEQIMAVVERLRLLGRVTRHGVIKRAISRGIDAISCDILLGRIGAAPGQAKEQL
jgi:hypothetical protein